MAYHRLGADVPWSLYHDLVDRLVSTPSDENGGNVMPTLEEPRMTLAAEIKSAFYEYGRAISNGDTTIPAATKLNKLLDEELPAALLATEREAYRRAAEIVKDMADGGRDPLVGDIIDQLERRAAEGGGT